MANNRLRLVALLGLTWLWPSAPAMERGLAAQGPVMKAHFIDVGQANATLLELKCGVVLIDAGAQDDDSVCATCIGCGPALRSTE